MTDAPTDSRTTSRASVVGLLLALAAACGRAVVTHDPLPGWGLDPFTTPAPADGIGPAGEVALAAVAFLGLALVLEGARRTRRPLPRLLLSLAAIGTLPVLYHGWISPDRSVAAMSVGASWAGAIACSLAAFVACREKRLRSLTLGVCAGLVAPLVFRAALQVYSEHPALVEDFRQRRDEILAGHGWTPDSAMARAYERRLAQPDASAWFAMSNVYASLMAGTAGMFGAGVIALCRERVWRSRDRRDLYRALGVGGGLLLSIGGIALALPAGGAPPKGGIAAMLLALALVAVAAVWPSLPRVRNLLRGEVLGIGVVLLALVAVVFRGLIGERLGELSLYFRWFYIEAAARIFLEHPLTGVAPDGFQNAYLVAKNPLNPEEVSSPHSVFFEYLATLGILGAAWIGLLLTLAARAGSHLLGSPDTAPADQAPADGAPADRAKAGYGRCGSHSLAAIVIVSCAALAFLREPLPLALSVPGATGLLVFDGAVKSLAWSLLWFGLAAAVIASARERWVRVGLGAGALAVLAHSQIELTATDPGAAGWAFLVLGAAAASDPLPASPRRGPVPRVVAVGIAALLAAFMAAAAVPLASWEISMRGASRLASEPIRFARRSAAIAVGDSPESPERFLSDLTAAVGHSVKPTSDGVRAALEALRLRRAGEAADRMEALAREGLAPSPAATRAAIRARGFEASLRGGAGPPDPGKLEEARVLARLATERRPGDSRAWRDLARLERLLPSAGSAGPTDLLERAAALDPHSPDLALEIAESHASVGDAEAAAAWARRALAADEFMRLDPLAGLSESEAGRAHELSGGP